MTIKWYNCIDDKKTLNKFLDFVDESTCNIYGVCNMDNPNFIVDNVKGNYVSFGDRCYFVNSRTYMNGKWLISCTADDLTNNHNELVKLDVLVARSESFRNNNIIDNLITIKPQRQIIGKNYGKDVISNTETSYIIGVI